MSSPTTLIIPVSLITRLSRASASSNRLSSLWVRRIPLIRSSAHTHRVLASQPRQSARAKVARVHQRQLRGRESATDSAHAGDGIKFILALALLCARARECGYFIPDFFSCGGRGLATYVRARESSYSYKALSAEPRRNPSNSLSLAGCALLSSSSSSSSSSWSRESSERARVSEW